MLNKPYRYNASRSKMVAHGRLYSQRSYIPKQREYGGAQGLRAVDPSNASFAGSPAVQASSARRNRRSRKKSAKPHHQYVHGAGYEFPDGFSPLTEYNVGTRRYNKRAVAWKHAED